MTLNFISRTKIVTEIGYMELKMWVSIIAYFNIKKALDAFFLLHNFKETIL